MCAPLAEQWLARAHEIRPFHPAHAGGWERTRCGRPAEEGSGRMLRALFSVLSQPVRDDNTQPRPSKQSKK